MNRTTWTSTEDHGHYYGTVTTIATVEDGNLTVTSGGDFSEIARLADLYEKEGDTAVAGGHNFVKIRDEHRADIALTGARVAAANNSSGVLTTLLGNPYISWEFPIDSPILSAFLNAGLSMTAAS